MLEKIKQLFTKPPILFPLAALFHIIFTVLAIVSLYPTPVSQRDWLRPLAMVIFSILAVGLCMLRKSVAILYIGLSIASLGLIAFSAHDSLGHIFGDSFFPFNFLLSFFILLFFKKFKY